MAEEKRQLKTLFQGFIGKTLKATIKGILFYGVYFALSMLIAPISQMIQSFQQTIEIFVITYIFLIVVGELAAETILYHVFNTVKALFVILYLAFSLEGGIVNITLQNMDFMVDLRLFLVLAMFLGLLGLAKSMLQAIKFLNDRTEYVQL